MKKLYRSEHNKIMAGILGGIGEYFNVDPVVVRVFFIFFAFAAGILPLVIAYVICLFIIPRNPESINVHKEK